MVFIKPPLHNSDTELTGGGYLNSVWCERELQRN
ncbi:MAG: hypothetical protein ACI92B_001467 [Marinobacter maritimus]|jgi:hypothetical protein